MLGDMSVGLYLCPLVELLKQHLSTTVARTLGILASLTPCLMKQALWLVFAAPWSYPKNRVKISPIMSDPLSYGPKKWHCLCSKFHKVQLEKGFPTLAHRLSIES